MATDDKYDRQVRLWGANGQKALAMAHILVLGTSSAVSETLKNLVLPGIGKFTTIDNAKVTQRDLGHDFFVSEEDIGQDKCEVVCKMMVEMNPDVKGAWIVSSVADFINSQAEQIKQCQLVIASDIDLEQAMQLSNIVQPFNIPLCILRQYGMIGYIRSFKAVNELVEGKNIDNPFKRDLRLTQPWPELKDFAYQFNFDELEEYKATHVPYAAILIQAVDKWRASHNGQLPQTFNEKQKEFTALINTMNKYGGENFDQAKGSKMDVWQSEFPPATLEIVNDPSCETKNNEFWLFAAGLKAFIAEEKRLPVTGLVPDMISFTELYLQLQNIYIKKAEEDRAKLRQIVIKITQQRGVQNFVIDEAKLLSFCRNVKQMEVRRMRSLTEEVQTPDWNLCDLSDLSWNEESTANWFVVIRAFELVRLQKGNIGDDFSEQDAEYAIMRLECDKITSSAEQQPINEKFIREILRFGTSKLHCISAYLGGVASLECLKMMMDQYIPMRHTFVYDGVFQRGQVFNL